MRGRGARILEVQGFHMTPAFLRNSDRPGLSGTRAAVGVACYRTTIRRRVGERVTLSLKPELRVPCPRLHLMSELTMIRTLLMQGVVFAGAVACGMLLPLWPAIGVWAGIALVLCVLGAVLIASQPMGTPTLAGLIGSSVTRYGYRVGDGRLPFAVAVSWFFWIVVGSAAIAIVHHRVEFWSILLLLTWLVLALALAYIIGQVVVASKSGRVPGSLVRITVVLALLLIVSAGLAAGGHRGFALAVAGIPVAIVGGGYGLFVLLILTVGRNARWN